MEPLNILHVFRAPVGGLFRHVHDLAAEQAARGHRVGLIADSKTGGARAEKILAELAPKLSLGLLRMPMSRHAGISDLVNLARVTKRIKDVGADIVHGHGAKGGTYARLAFNHPRAARVYTPHGGSLLFSNANLSGKFYLGTEKLLMPRGDLYLFESAFSAEAFRHKIGNTDALVRVVHNGVSRREFEPVVLAPEVTDLLFLGELRMLKGVDVLIDAIAQLHLKGRAITATLVGDGPDRALFQEQIERLGLAQAIRFTGAMPARQALGLGRVMMVPSRAESLPYVVLETAAAGKPIITTQVGGIPEIFGPLADRLVPSDDAPALAAAIERTLDQPDATAKATVALRERVATGFSVETMVNGVLAGYQEVLDVLRRKGRR